MVTTINKAKFVAPTAGMESDHGFEFDLQSFFKKLLNLAYEQL